MTLSTLLPAALLGCGQGRGRARPQPSPSWPNDAVRRTERPITEPRRGIRTQHCVHAHYHGVLEIGQGAQLRGKCTEVIITRHVASSCKTERKKNEAEPERATRKTRTIDQGTESRDTPQTETSERAPAPGRDRPGPVQSGVGPPPRGGAKGPTPAPQAPQRRVSKSESVVQCVSNFPA